MVRDRVKIASALLTLVLYGCGGGSLCCSNGGGGGGGTGPVTLTTAQVNGTVALPPGYALSPASLRVATAAGESQVGAGGAFTASVYNDGLQLCTVLGPSGKPVLAGWLGAGRTTMSARSTAEVLLFFGLGAYAHRSAVSRWSIEQISTRPEVAPLEQAIVAALATDPEALCNGAPAITDAAKTAVNGITSSRAARVQGRSTSSRSALIDPADTRSGMTPVQDGINSVRITNAYRRRGWAYFDRVSYVPASGGDAVPSPAKVKDFEVSAVAGAAGLIGTFVDIMYGNNAYSQITTDAVSLPVEPANAQKTTYQLTIVGTGFSAGDEPRITADQAKGRNWVIGKSIVLDFLIPIYLNCIMPKQGDAIDRQLEQYQANALLADFINTMASTVPSVWVKANAGDMQGAAWDAANALRNSTTLKLLFIDMIRAGFVNIGNDFMQAQQFMKYAESFMAVLGLGDFIMTVFDSAVQVTQAGLSNRADIWTITVNGSKVMLTPAVSFIMADENATLHAAVPDATGSSSPPVLAYHWKNTGTVGRLGDGMHTGNEFDSSVADVTFTPTGNVAGSDTVTVEVFKKEGGTQTSLGTATATVTVQDRSKAPVLYPRRVSVFPTDKQTFNARIDTVAAGGGQFTYVWTVPGSFGLLDLGVTRLETTSNTATYQARLGAEGTENLRVEVFQTKDGVRKSLGSATSEIRIEKRRSIVMGSFSVEQVLMGGTLPWIEAYVKVPKVDGAERYSVNCYGFFDFAWYGSSLSFAIPPVPGDVGDHPGDAGSEYWYGLAGTSDTNAGPWYYQRFGGMVVEVTVTYAH